MIMRQIPTKLVMLLKNPRALGGHVSDTSQLRRSLQTVVQYKYQTILTDLLNLK